MLIQVYIDSEQVQKCDLLIAREDAVVNVPVTGLKDLQAASMDVKIVKPHENMAMKAAIYAAEAISKAEAVSSPVYIACPDKNILDGMCSMDYVGPAGGPIKCVPSGTKSQAPPRVRNRAKPKTSDQANADAAPKPKKPEGAATAGNTENQNLPAAGSDSKQPETDDVRDALNDPGLVKGDEVNTDPGAAETQSEAKPDPTMDNTKKIMAILKDRGVPSGQIPGVLEALRESMDAQITLPMQVRLKLAKDDATGDMDPEQTAKLIAPVFDELKKYLKEIDDHNAKKS